MDLTAVAVEGADPAPTDQVQARWPDGDVRVMSELIRSDLSELDDSLKGKRECGVLWFGHDKDGALIEVKHRVDRVMLTSIFLKKKQVLQVKQSCFDDADASMAFMVSLAQKLAKR